MTKRYDWANKVDPDTGARTRFCTRCEAFLPLAKFYACHVKRSQLICREHSKALAIAPTERWRAKQQQQGALGRIRENLNRWIRRVDKAQARWTNEDVALALQKHSVNLGTETRIVRLRPRDPALPFDAENSVVQFQRGSGGRKRQPSSI